MVPPNNLGPGLNGKAVNETQYRGMIRSLMYLTTSRHGFQFSTCLYARYQANSKKSYLIAVKRIFRKITLGACQLLAGKLVCCSVKKQQSVAMSSAEAEYVAVVGCCANILWMKSQLTDYAIIYEKCLGGKTNRLDQISNKDATILYCLANGVKVDFARLIWEDIIDKLNKKTRENFVPYPRFISLLLEYMMPEYDHEDLTINPTQVFIVHNWALKPNQPEGPLFLDHMKDICNIDVPMDSQAPKTSSQTEKVPQGKKPGAKNKETQSSLAKEKISSHPSAPTPVVAEMHKETQQTAAGPTSLGATSEKGAHPQLNSDSTVEADPRKYAPNDSIP
ncbi:hypothetical protein Tco_1363416 [Tanacetum coccineum]